MAAAHEEIQLASFRLCQSVAYQPRPTFIRKLSLSPSGHRVRSYYLHPFSETIYASWQFSSFRDAKDMKSEVGIAIEIETGTEITLVSLIHTHARARARARRNKIKSSVRSCKKRRNRSAGRIFNKCFRFTRLARGSTS